MYRPLSQMLFASLEDVRLTVNLNEAQGAPNELTHHTSTDTRLMKIFTDKATWEWRRLDQQTFDYYWSLTHA